MTASRTRRLVKVLSWFNALCFPLLLVALFSGLSLSTDFFKPPVASTPLGATITWAVMILLVLYFIGTPAAGITALVVNRRVRIKAVTWINVLVLAQWGLLCSGMAVASFVNEFGR